MFFLFCALLTGLGVMALLWPLSHPPQPAEKTSPYYGPSLLALLCCPLAALGLYIHLGSPALSDMPLAKRIEAIPEKMDPAVMLSKITQHLEKNPEDLQGWKMLSMISLRLEKLPEAIRAYRNIIALSGESVAHNTMLALLLIQEDHGKVGTEARALLQAALRRAPDPTQPGEIPLSPQAQRAEPLYYLGLAALQDGKKEEARKIWMDLLRDSPQDAPWIASVQKQLDALDSPLTKDMSR